MPEGTEGKPQREGAQIQTEPRKLTMQQSKFEHIVDEACSVVQCGASAAEQRFVSVWGRLLLVILHLRPDCRREDDSLQETAGSEGA